MMPHSIVVRRYDTRPALDLSLRIPVHPVHPVLGSLQQEYSVSVDLFRSSLNPRRPSHETS
ncbi:hypothetical protein BDW67DRAFT_158158 [Aspergillus spinulosporus]